MFKIRLFFSDNTVLLMDDVYDTLDETEDAYKKWTGIHFDLSMPDEPLITGYEVVTITNETEVPNGRI